MPSLRAAAFIFLIVVSGGFGSVRSALAQSVFMGQTELALGMKSEEAIGQLSREFIVKQGEGSLSSMWNITSYNKSDKIYYYRGYITAKDGKIVVIGKDFTPDRPTPASIGEAFFLMLDRLAPYSGEGCRIVTSREGIESGPGAGGTRLSARIECKQYVGSLLLSQGGSSDLSHDPTISFTLKSSYMVK
jgi:hypothetical protein